MISSPKNYSWNKFNCAYTIHQSETTIDDNLALVLIHPIGVGLSGVFWHRFVETWFNSGQKYTLYNPDLLGCGKSDMPHVCYYPEDWAKQLKYFIETVVKKPVILVVQGALFPVAIRLIQNPPQPNFIKGLALSGPPAWGIMTEPTKPLQQKLLWNLLFNSPLGIGNAFYRYARRRKFLQSFSVRQLFEKAEMVDDNWLDFLEKGATNLDSRYAVFSFLAGFWRQDYTEDIKSIQQPTLAIFGEQASSISKEGKTETADQRLESYLKHLPNGQGCKISGRNVMPYESPNEFASVLANFVKSRY
ncbi:MAG TPA: alpha/beta hydrolase [Cyanothece sp. UBA12306]|nr:alpha/beta hydrolase [Cyanothece sp. UBA12306]